MPQPEVLSNETPSVSSMDKHLSAASAQAEGHPALRLLETFNALHAGNLHRLAEVYDAQIRFTDPAHTLQGLEAMERYFAKLYAQAISCQFELEHSVLGPDESALFWVMELRHRGIDRGRPVRIHGASHLKHGERVTFHRDYFDLGALIYERLPLLGRIVVAIRRRLGAE